VKTPFSKLLVCLSLALVSAPSIAAPVVLGTQTINGPGSTQWDITNTGGTSTGLPFTGNCSSLVGLVIQDADSASGDGDHYDNAWEVFINNVIVAPPGGVVDVTGNVVTAGPVSMSGLNVTVQYRFSTVNQTARILVTLQNPTGAPIAVPVAIPVNVGSNGSTAVLATSSGDLVVTSADRWLVSWDGSSEINTIVFYGPGAGVVPTISSPVFNCAGPEGWGATYNVSVPAGGTVSVMTIAGVGGTVGTVDTSAAAISNAPQFDSTSSAVMTDLLSDLTPTQIAQIVNWAAVAAPVASIAVPTLSEWVQVFMAGLLALLGVFGLRRRKS
jgi:hypothetical protein